MNLLILGGTSEATRVAVAVAADPRFAATISLAGRTLRPAAQAVPCRIGGFGGVKGLARHLVAHRIHALLDATHPFAAQMTRHAEAAAALTDTLLLVIQRPAWQPVAGDTWRIVPDIKAAAAALGTVPRRVLLTIGRKDLAPFVTMPWHRYIIRSVDAPPSVLVPPGAVVIAARGPFAEADERDLLREHRVEILVTKNSGGEATFGKLFAARALGLPVIMVARPAPPSGETVATVAEALAWLDRHHAARRGV